MGAVGINFGAATSGDGFNVTTTVASIVANLQQIENPWNTALTALKADDTAFTSIGTDLSSLASSVSALTDFEGVMAEKEGSSSNPDVLTLSSASATASAGTHSVVVGQLAQTSSVYSAVIPTSDILSGGLTIQVGNGTATTIPVVSGTSDTIANYAAAINAAGIGVTASVISDTTGSRLSLVSGTSGLAGQLTVTNAGGTTKVTSAPTAAATSVASDTSTVATNTFTLPVATDELSGLFNYAVGSGAAATVDLGSTPLSLTSTADALNADIGFSASGLVASVSGASLVITGTTGADGAATIDTSGSSLTTTTPPVTVSPLTDTSTTTPTAVAMKSALPGQDALLTVDGISIDSASNTVSTAIPGVTFQLLSTSTAAVQVEITNDNNDVESAVQSFVSAYNTVLTDLKTQEGNTTSGAAEPLYGNPIVSQLQSALALALTSGTGSGSITGLDQLGITVSNTGALTLDTSTLDSALNSNYSDAVGFFQNSGSFGQMLSTTLEGLVNSSPMGAITLALNADANQETAYNADVTAENALIATDQSNLTTELNAANQALQAIPQQLNEVNELYSSITGYNTGNG